MPETPNFTLSEFACSCGCSENRTKLGLLSALQEVRDLFGRGIKIASGYRCEFHNKGVGGSPKSSHILGLAADIAIPDSSYAFHLMKAIFESHRFQRVGYGKMSGTLVLHVDIDLDKSQKVLWGY